MGKWTDDKQVTPGKGGAVQLRIPAGMSLTDDLEYQATTTISAARIALEWTVGRLSAVNQLDLYTVGLLAECFNTPADGPDQPTFEKIKTTLVTIQTGLAEGGLRLKVADLGPKAAGAVKFHPGPSAKPNRVAGQRIDVSGGQPRIEAGARGDIKISTQILAYRGHDTLFYLPVKVLIHEASHRYASTQDFYYYTKLPDRDPVWSVDKGVPINPGETPPLKFLKFNADSYGWFAALLYYFSPV
jgi:hypothetical protein